MDNNNKKSVHQVNLVLTNNPPSHLSSIFEKKNDLKQNSNKLNLDSYEKSLIDNILLSKNDDFISVNHNNNKKTNNNATHSNSKSLNLNPTNNLTNNYNNSNNISYSNTNNNYLIPPYWCNDELVPLVYKQIFDASRISNCDEINTELLYPILLLSSNIDRSLLGKIWSLVNRTLPGRLVKHELYMALALIALAQSNIDISNIDILNQLNTIPIPTFQIQINNNSNNNSNNLEEKSDSSSLNNQLFTNNHESQIQNQTPTLITSNNNNSNTNEFNNITTINSDFANFDSPILDIVQNDAPCFNENTNNANNTIDDNNENKIDDKYSYFTNNDQDYSQNRIEVWDKCLNSINEIHERVLLLVNEFCSKSDDNKNECKQIIKSNKGEAFIKSLVEVYNLVDRINASINKYNVLNDDLNNKISEITKKFKLICESFNHVDETTIHSNKYTNGYHDVNKLNCCSLCLCPIRNEDTLIISGCKSYHNTCINFWLNCVDQYNFPNLV